MEETVIETVTIGGAAANMDLSVWALFLRADLVVQAVIVLLLVASIWCWAIIFEKALMLRRLNGLAREFETAFWSGRPVDELYDRLSPRPRDPMSAVFVAAMGEWQRGDKRGEAATAVAGSNVEERVERVMQLTVAREVDRVERHIPFLASTGATAPFVGLFGTVWGIMNSFQAIGVTKSTSLAVVAPGIAEALFATALGLLAAIPAVLAYNKLSRDVERYAGRLDGFMGEFMAFLSRRSMEAH